jgi:hypothetical protein
VTFLDFDLHNNRRFVKEGITFVGFRCRGRVGPGLSAWKTRSINFACLKGVLCALPLLLTAPGFGEVGDPGGKA